MSVHIVSYNIHRSLPVLEDLLEKPALKSVHILLLQETPSALPVTPGWRILLPTPVRAPKGETHRNRAVVLVSDQVKLASIEQIRIESPDILGIDLRTETGQLLRILNIYNPASGSAEHLLTHNESVRRLGDLLACTPTEAGVVVAGDFNLHHQEWEPALAQEPTPEAQEASRTFRDAGLVHLLPPGTETYRSPSGSLHCNDLVLADLRMEEKMISCQIDESLDAQSDHRPIRLVLDLAATAATKEVRRSFRRACPEKLQAAYARFSAELPAPDRLLTAADLDLEAERLTKILISTIESAVPTSKPRHECFAHPWWSDELAHASREAKNAKNVAWRKSKRGDVDAAEATLMAKVVANRKKAMMRRAKAAWERKAVENVDESNLWRKVKEAMGSAHAQAATPPLQAGTDAEGNTTYATSPAAKLDLLRPVLLPQVDPAGSASQSSIYCMQPPISRDGLTRFGEETNVLADEPDSIPATTSTEKEPAMNELHKKKATSKGESNEEEATMMRRVEAKSSKAKLARAKEPETEKANDGVPASLKGEKVSIPFSVSPLPRLDGLTRFGEDMDIPADPNLPTLDWPELREEEVKSALFGARPHSAPGSDGVPFVALQHLWPILRLRLLPLYAASLRLGHLPRSWRDAVGVVLRKPKKPDYSVAKAYRLIAFEKTSAKVLESIVARRLAYLAERHQLLPAEHFGGRQGRSVDESVTCFVDEIKRQWRNGNVVVGVALDVAKAFPSVQTDALCNGLARKGLPQRAVKWIRSFMSDRTCDL